LITGLDFKALIADMAFDSNRLRANLNVQHLVDRLRQLSGLPANAPRAIVAIAEKKDAEAIQSELDAMLRRAL
jgi:hypothetical protein